MNLLKNSKLIRRINLGSFKSIRCTSFQRINFTEFRNQRNEFILNISFPKRFSSYGTKIYQDKENTIYALSSGSQYTKSAISVIRVSGYHSINVLKELTLNNNIPKPREATRRSLYDPETKEKIDEALVLYFPAPKSFTGEDIIEFHIHGSKSVMNGVLFAISNLSKSIPLSLAEPGQFTRRAFENGKLDLTEVEGLIDLINSETEAQRSQALKQMNGESSKYYNHWKDEIVTCLAHFEAVIDFGEDQQIGDHVLKEVIPRVQKLVKSMEIQLNDKRGERIREGLDIVIFGPPNSGKSSFINILTKRQLSIVSAIPGTTRDVVEASMDFGGFPVVFSDTAGIRDSTDAIEVEGIHRTKERLKSADLKIGLFDVNHFSNLSRKDQDQYLNLLEMVHLEDKNFVIVLNKMDLYEQLQQNRTTQIDTTTENKQIQLFKQKIEEELRIKLNENDDLDDFL